MAEINEDNELEELGDQEQQSNRPDHIPLKDEFSSDLSDIDLNDYEEKQE